MTTLRAAIAALVIVATATAAQATGYYNVPANARQWFGYGAGPGYHANLLLGPAIKAPTAARRVQRLRAPLSASQAPPSLHGFGPAMSVVR